jgi:hypothetical protein
MRRTAILALPLAAVAALVNATGRPTSSVAGVLITVPATSQTTLRNWSPLRPAFTFATVSVFVCTPEKPAPSVSGTKLDAPCARRCQA